MRHGRSSRYSLDNTAGQGSTNCLRCSASNLPDDDGAFFETPPLAGPLPPDVFPPDRSRQR